MPDVLPLSRRNALRLAGIVCALAVAAAVWIAAGIVGRTAALDDVRMQAAASMPLAASVLRSEIAKQRTVPLVLAGDPDIHVALSAPTPARLAVVDRRLAALAATTGASVLYLLDRTGLTVAASNFSEPTSFVGSDYRFRRYFTGAIAEGAAEQYALGTVSRRPGLYLSQRVDADGTALGVVVLKVELADVESDWHTSGNLVFASDDRGIVLATSRDALRYRTLHPIDGMLAAGIRESLQFGGAPLTPMPLGPDRDGLTTLGENGGAPRYLALDQPLGDPRLPWRLHLLAPADAAMAMGMASARRQALALAAVALTIGIYLVRRRRRALARQRNLRRAADELERRVLERTGELREANGQLKAAIAARGITERRLDELRIDLEQANRLATLGQITAGVAHEINQPLAAIRTYAENADRFLARGDTPTARQNLASVVGLTTRIGAITETLRGFARRGHGEMETIVVADALDGAEMVLRGLLDGAGVVLVRDPALATLRVHGERIRLEQVLVNLLRNAVEASTDRPLPRIAISAERHGEDILFHVADNGTGIAPEALRTLFTPFSTTKARGLGLGLVIAKDILSEWGGDLSAESRPNEGATFTLRLKAAP
ncbi:ATP-binding protein [Aureimonas sp. AU12]|uniref:sensor histidine kinase n=1 Tax=Aureimonas sp. AU12 TaxID=1638161 RepID=UPI000AD59325|nr:ATP-binding protein [Aureimonas sp. AU12]